VSTLLSYDPISLLDKGIASNERDRYYSLLMEENRKVNLVSRETSRADFDRLLCESLLPLEVIAAGAALSSLDAFLDIGSGGGIPAVPILQAVSVSGRAILLERTRKKAAALRRIVAGLGLSCEISGTNYDQFTPIEGFSLITVRYIKLTPGLLSRIVGHLSSDGVFVYYAAPDFETRDMRADVHTFESLQDQIIKSFTLFRKKH
jgi:16S rRNA G527 N7-methylase RsmG